MGEGDGYIHSTLQAVSVAKKLDAWQRDKEDLLSLCLHAGDCLRHLLGVLPSSATHK